MGNEPARAAKRQRRGLSKSAHSTNAAEPAVSGRPGVIYRPCGASTVLPVLQMTKLRVKGAVTAHAKRLSVAELPEPTPDSCEAVAMAAAEAGGLDGWGRTQALGGVSLR